MLYKYIYKTPANFSDLLIVSDGTRITELSFINSKISIKSSKNLSPFKEVIRWLDLYFKGEVPNFTPKYRILNIIPFRKEVLDIVSTIKYGKIMTYGEIASKFKNCHMSAQAVGGAVSKNPIAIIIPCHRVLGKDQKLVGYAGGLSNKLALLKLEKTKKLREEP